MSAVAAVASTDGIVLLSDGITFYADESGLPENRTLTRDNCTIHSTDTSKIIKINNQVGVLWVGNTMPDLQEHFKLGCEAKGLTDPGEIAYFLSDLLKKKYAGKDISSITGTYYNVVIAVTGFDSAGIPWGYDISSNREFTPAKNRLAQHGIQPVCIAPFVDRETIPFIPLLQKHNKQTTNPRKCATAAFTEMIRDYEAQGMVVGGKIFCEVLYPLAKQKESLFQQAIRRN